MRRILLFLVLLGAVAVAGWTGPAPLAHAQPLDAGELVSVFPEYPGDQAEVSRGEYAALLVKAANMPLDGYQVPLPGDVAAGAWYAPYINTLYREGILRGYPDGTLRPEATVTRLEAVVLVSRVLGLPDGAAAAGQVPGLEDSNWAYVPYSWLFTWGIVAPDADPAGKMLVGEAVKFLAQVFGSDPEAEAIVEKSQQVQKDTGGISFTGDMAMTMRPRAGIPGWPEQLKALQMQGRVTTEVRLPATLHQAMQMKISLPPEILGPEVPAIPPMDFEQYLVDGVMYQKITDPTTGEARWMRLPKEATPDMKALMEAIQKNEFYQQAIPEELRPYLHYRLQGTTERDGRQVYKIISYGRIDDFAAFMKAALPENMQEMLLDPQVAEGMGSMNDLIRTMTYWGTSYIGVDDYLTYGEEFRAVIGFGEKFMGEAFPLEVMEMHMQAGDYRYGDDIVIELPPEALKAEELPLPEAR